MSDLARDAALVAAGSAFVFLGKLLDKAFGWRRSREDFATQLRNELRADMENLKEEIEDLRKQVDEWREKYLKERELNSTLRNDYADLRREFDSLRRHLEEEGVKS